MQEIQEILVLLAAVAVVAVVEEQDGILLHGHSFTKRTLAVVDLMGEVHLEPD
jgi:hypothetical protein